MIKTNTGVSAGMNLSNFRLTFANGWEVSVQHGTLLQYREQTVSGRATVGTSGEQVEVAVFNPDGDFFRLDDDWGDDVLRVNADELAEVIARVVKL